MQRLYFPRPGSVSSGLSKKSAEDQSQPHYDEHKADDQTDYTQQEDYRLHKQMSQHVQEKEPRYQEDRSDYGRSSHIICDACGYLVLL